MASRDRMTVYVTEATAYAFAPDGARSEVREYFLAAVATGSECPDAELEHEHRFVTHAEAAALLRRVQRTIGGPDGTVARTRLEGSKHWYDPTAVAAPSWGDEPSDAEMWNRADRMRAGR